MTISDGTNGQIQISSDNYVLVRNMTRNYKACKSGFDFFVSAENLLLTTTTSEKIPLSGTIQFSISSSKVYKNFSDIQLTSAPESINTLNRWPLMKISFGFPVIIYSAIIYRGFRETL